MEMGKAILENLNIEHVVICIFCFMQRCGDDC